MRIARYWIIALLATACTDLEPAPEVTANFTARVEGEAPNALLYLTNNSTGATQFLWSFSGLPDSTSREKNPSPVLVDRAGSIRIVLEAGNGIQASREETTLEVAGESPILYHQNIRLRITDNVALPRYYAAYTNSTFLDDEVSGENGPKVDLVLVVQNPQEAYFASPNDQELDFPINQASTTIIDQDLSDNTFGLTEYEAMDNAAALDSLTITADPGTFSLSQLPFLLLFQTTEGYKGALKVNSVNFDEGYLEAEVKVQKYL